MVRVDDIERDRLTATAAAVPTRTAPLNARLETAGPRGVTAVWRSFNLEGYLERKLHRQWRNRGS